MPKIKLQRLDCYIPSVGRVKDFYTGKLVDRQILKRSSNESEQYWERTTLPTGWRKKRLVEKAKQFVDSEYFDQELEEFRRQEWDRRLNGVWFLNNGRPEYLTGLNYFYLNWWRIDSGYPDFRKTDWEYFMVMDKVIRDENCGGLIELTKRRAGKTARSGVFLYEFLSRFSNGFGGIQSKSEDDAKKNVFRKFLIQPFKHLPDFFRPNYDTTQGISPTTELRFFNPSKRGAAAEEYLDEPELETTISYASAKDKAYDGSKQHRYVSDEAAKLPSEHDIYERHQVVKLCCEENTRIIGKMLYTTTVEEMGGKDEKGRSMKMGGVKFKDLWKDSDQDKRTDNGRTISWLYQFFTPAYQTIYFDKYGYADEKRARTYYLAERKAVEHDSRKLNSIIRKAPFTVEEAFRSDSENCLFNANNLNDRMDFFSYADPNSLYTRGALVEPEEGKMEFRPSKNGRFQIHERPEHENRVRRRGTRLEPMNGSQYVIGVDPYSHSKTNSGRGSMGAAYVFKRPTLGDLEGKFVAQYIFRPQTIRMFYEDMRKLAHYYGAPLLLENNKQGLLEYFHDNEYSRFLMWLPNQKSAGVPASKQSHQEMAEELELYIEDYCHLIPFKELIDDLIDFDLDETERYDATMAAGWTLVAHKYLTKRWNRKGGSSTVGQSRMFQRNKL